MTNNNFVDLFLKHDGKRIDKWEQYVGIYAAELEPLIARGTPVRLLEIGIQNGGSLELWSKFLPTGSLIRGIDIDDRVAHLAFDNANISVDVADATEVSKMEELLGNEAFDVIIDDGSHRSSHVITSFGLLYRYLKPGGKYVIEDLHCSYFASHEGGYRSNQSSVEWLKNLIDVLNADHIAPDEKIDPQEQELIDTFKASLARITFYDSVAVVEKLSAEKTRPYRRMLTGCHTPLVTDEYWVSVAPVGHFKPMLFGQAAARRLESKLIAHIEEVKARADGELIEAQRQLEAARQQVSQIERKAADTLARLEVEHRDLLQAAADERESLQRAMLEQQRTALEHRDAAHQLTLQTALKERDATMQAALTERNIAHQHALRAALDARETHFRRELGATLSIALKVKTGLQRILRRAGRAVQQRWDTFRPANRGTTLGRHEMALCRPLFDEEWYLKQYPDVAAAGVDPLEHFLAFGARECRDPNPLFSTSWYLKHNPDVAAAQVNPLLHYIVHGAAEGRDPHEMFNTHWYLQHNPDVAASGINPLAHYLVYGVAEGRQPRAPADV